MNGFERYRKALGVIKSAGLSDSQTSSDETNSADDLRIPSSVQGALKVVGEFLEKGRGTARGLEKGEARDAALEAYMVTAGRKSNQLALKGIPSLRLMNRLDVMIDRADDAIEALKKVPAKRHSKRERNPSAPAPTYKARQKAGRGRI